MLLQVKFKCRTCEYFNKELTTKDLKLRNTEFESLSDAWEHLQGQDFQHTIEAYTELTPSILDHI